MSHAGEIFELVRVFRLYVQVPDEGLSVHFSWTMM